MGELVDYSVTAANNNAAVPDGMAEGVAPSGVNNSWREGVARQKRDWKDKDGSVTTGGTATAFTATLNKGTTTLADLGPMILEMHATAGAAPTLAVNAGTAKNLAWADGTNVAASDFTAQTRLLILYDADKDKFCILSAQAKPFATPTTTRGDIIYRGVSADSRLALGAVNTLLQSDGTDPRWRTLTLAIDDAIGSTQGQILYRSGTVWTALAVGTNGQFLKTQGAAANPAWATVSAGPFAGTLFTSSDQTITAAGALTIAHGLASIPTQVTLALVCQTAEANYSIGDVLHDGGGCKIQGNDGNSIVVDATNLNIRFGDASSTFTAPNKTTGAAASLTNANWKVRYYAWY